MKLRNILIIFFASILSVACHSGRSASQGGSNSSAYVGGDAAKALGSSQLKDMLGRLEASYGIWENVKVPVTLKLKSPKKLSVGGTLTMQRDRSIHLSLRVLGMEMASLMVTQDSIYAVYKLDRLYFAESISDLLGGFPATVGNVQNLLLGRALALGDKTLTDVKCSLSGNGLKWTITPAQNPRGISYDFTVDTPSGNVEQLTVNLPSRKPIEARYSDFTVAATGPIAATTELTASTSKNNFSAEISLNSRLAEWGKGDMKTWTVPKGYTRVKAADIMKMLSRM